jgi:RND superfamily putative drug exporter
MKPTVLERMAGYFTGKWSRWVTLLVWIALIAILSSVWPQVNSQTANNAALFSKEYPSVVSQEIQAREFPSDAGLPAIMVWYRESGLTDTDYASLQKLTEDLTANPIEAQSNVVPLQLMPTMVVKEMASASGKALLLPIFFEDEAGAEALKEARSELFERVDAAFAGSKPYETAVDDSTALMLRFTGPVGIQLDATDLFLKADLTLLITTFLLVLVLLLLIYRSPILALIPLIGVGFAYGVISPVLGWMAQQGWIVVDDQATSIMSVLLFGAGTDYCLFLIARYRDMLKQEPNKFQAMVKAFSGTTGAITMSGLTVVFGLITLLLADQGNIQRFAVPFSVAVFVMMIASLTIVPALLSILGRTSFWPFSPRTEPMLRERAEKRNKLFVAPKEGGKIGKWMGRIVVKRPWAIVIITVVVLGSMAAVVPQIKYTYDILSSFPKDMASREGFAMIGEQFSPGDLAPVTVMVDTEGKDIAVKQQLEALTFLDRVSEPVAGKENGNIQAWTVEFNGNPYDTDVVNQIPQIREAATQALQVAGISDGAAKIWIAGQSATQYDQQVANKRDIEVIVPIVIGLIALLLLVYLRSIVATVYLMLTVILSFFSALGIGWLVLHYGMGTEAISGAIPLYAFVFIVALGEDYNIFMVSSIWQKRRKMALNDAISEGVSETSSVITSAGLILAGTFAVLASLPIQVLVQFGLITAIGVLLDTFIVRPFLVPAITVLLGKWSFWPGK